MRCGELSLPTVDDDEIGERLFVPDAALKVSRDHLAHRCEVVGSLDCLHPELPVFGSLCSSVLEPHGRADRIGSLSSRDVEADHGARKLLKTELATQLVHGIARASAAVPRGGAAPPGAVTSISRGGLD